MRAIVSIFIDADLYDAKETGIINFQPDATNLYRELKPKIIDNHETYAKSVNADYCLFQDSEMWKNYLRKIKDLFPNIAMYNYINYYKFYIAEYITRFYDEVLYVDFDAFFNTTDNFFEENDLSKFCVQTWDMPYFSESPRDIDVNIPKLRLMKAWYSQQLLEIVYNMNISEYNLFTANTGVHAYNKDIIDQLAFFNCFEDTIKTIRNYNDDCAEDNEVFFVAAAIKNKVPIHAYNHKWNFSPKQKPYEGKICHFTVKEHMKGFFE